MAVNGGLSIGAMSERTGVNIETIRYYERIGLIPAPPRSTGGHRLYQKEHLQRLSFMRRSRELGFSLDEIRTLLAMVDGGYSCAEVQALALRHLADIRAKIVDLRALEDTLKTVSDQCSGDTAPACPVIEALSEGAGAARQRTVRLPG